MAYLKSFIDWIVRAVLVHWESQVSVPTPTPDVLQPSITPTPKSKTMNEEKMYNAAKDALGTHQTLNDSVPAEVGCAEAWSSVAKVAGVQGIPRLGFAGTSDLYGWLSVNPQFEKLTTPEPGATIISPTGHGNGKIRGHVGILAKFGTQYINDWGICSNDSGSGLFREQWSLTEWKNYYAGVGKLPVDMFKFIG